MSRAAPPAAALLPVLAAGSPAWAQSTPPIPVREIPPLLVRMPEEPKLSARPYQPLAPAQLGRLRAAQQLRDAGRLDRARDSLLALLAEVPHHPVILTELARLHLARQDYVAVERMGRFERFVQRDSLVLGHELSLALERLGRPRDAAQVAIEIWSVAPAEAEWASEWHDFQPFWRRLAVFAGWE